MLTTLAAIFADPIQAGAIAAAITAAVFQFAKARGWAADKLFGPYTNQIKAALTAIVVTLGTYLLSGQAWSWAGFASALTVAFFGSGGLYATFLRGAK